MGDMETHHLLHMDRNQEDVILSLKIGMEDALSRKFYSRIGLLGIKRNESSCMIK